MTARPPLQIHHAGVVGSVLEREIIPSFTDASGLTVERTGGHSVSLARRMLAGESRPDVYISADAEVNALLFAGGELASWFLTFAGVAMALIYSPRSRFRPDLDAAAEGATPWYEVLQRPGFRLCRHSPGDDPGGYRAVFVAQLAEGHFGQPGLARRILGDDDNPAQIVLGGLAAVEEGAADALLIYATIARDRGLPQVTLPDAINLGNPDFAAAYRTAAYTAPDGYTFRGTPARLSVTIPNTTSNGAGAMDFVHHLLSAEGQAALHRYGFLPAPVLVGGDATRVPGGLQANLQDRYAP